MVETDLFFEFLDIGLAIDQQAFDIRHFSKIL